MGQKILVSIEPTLRKNIFRFELDRTLTGMGYEHYSSDQVGQYLDISKVSANLAVRLLQKFSLESMDIFSNQITIKFNSFSNEADYDAVNALIADEISNFLGFY